MDTKKNARFPAKYVLMLFVSLALGGFGVYLSKQFIEDRISFYKSQMEVNDELISVVVPKQTLLRGTIVTPQAFAMRDFPKQYVDSNTVSGSTFDIAVGQRLNYDIDGGKPLLWAHLEGGLVPTFSGNIEDGHRALTIPVDEINSISGFLQPKDRVDLLLTYKKAGSKENMTFPFMQNLHILATGVKTVVDK